jgi:hypothetical protein
MAHDFVNGEYDKFVKEKNSKLAQRYFLLKNYFAYYKEKQKKEKS